MPAVARDGIKHTIEVLQSRMERTRVDFWKSLDLPGKNITFPKKELPIEEAEAKVSADTVIVVEETRLKFVPVLKTSQKAIVDEAMERDRDTSYKRQAKAYIKTWVDETDRLDKETLA